MSSVPIKNLAALLNPKKNVDVRRGAAVVVAELGLRDPAVMDAIHALLTDEDQGVRLAAIDAVGKLRIDKALETLVERVKHGGPESETAAEAVSKLGVKGKKALQELMHHVAPGLRKYIASALASSGADKSDADALGILQDKDPAIVDAAVHSLMGSVPNLNATQRKAMAEQLIVLASNKKAKQPPATEVAIVKLLSVLDDPRIGKLLWERTAFGLHPDVRIAALQAIGKFTASPGKDQLASLFAYAVEPDFRIAAPALMMLQHMKVTDKTAGDWLKLFDAQDTAARQFALDKLAGIDTPALLKVLVGQVKHHDRRYQEAVIKRLTSTEPGRKALTAALLDAETPDQAWPLARTLVPSAKGYTAKWREGVFNKIAGFIEENDRRADPLLFLLSETDAGDLRTRLETHAVELRKKKKYEEALAFLKVLARDPACGIAGRFELATVGLKLSAKELAEESRAKDHCLHQFSILLQHQQDEAELFAMLEKVKWLEPEDLYYLGFHFANHDGRAKKFGGLVLQLVLKRSPKSKIGQNAKAKLKTSGLA